LANLFTPLERRVFDPALNNELRLYIYSIPDINVGAF